jgi:hypothetical protein
MQGAQNLINVGAIHESPLQVLSRWTFYEAIKYKSSSSWESAETEKEIER